MTSHGILRIQKSHFGHYFLHDLFHLRPSLKIFLFAVLRPTRQNRRDPIFFIGVFFFFFFFFERNVSILRWRNDLAPMLLLIGRFVSNRNTLYQSSAWI